MRCDRCGKTSPDDARGCLAPTVFSPATGDWICELAELRRKPFALERGEDFYQGEPCDQGHPGIRATRNDTCIHCITEATAA